LLLKSFARLDHLFLYIFICHTTRKANRTHQLAKEASCFAGLFVILVLREKLDGFGCNRTDFCLMILFKKQPEF